MPATRPATTHRPRALRRGRRPRAFTLVETVVAAGLFALGVVTLLSVIVNLNETASAELSRSELQRAMVSLDAQIGRDLATSRPCEPHRVGTAWHRVAENVVQFTADPDGDGVTDLVTWELAGGQLLRSQIPDGGLCEFGAASPSVVVHGIDADGPAPALGLWVSHGAPDSTHVTAWPVAGHYDCAADPDACLNFDAVHVRARALTRDGTVLPVERTFDLPANRARLRP